MLRNFYLLVLFFFFQTILVAQLNIYVAPNGNDQNSGTSQKPFATLTKARDAIRVYKKTHNIDAPIIVHIEGGFYKMTEPFSLSPEDSGSKKFPVIYRAASGASPVFSGGELIEGVRVSKNGIWRADISKFGSFKKRFDQLYVNDNRAMLAKTPNSGFFSIAQAKENVFIKGTGRAPESAEQVFYFDQENFNPLKETTESDLETIRFRAYHKWDFTLRHINKIDKDSMSLKTSGKGMKPWNPIKKGGRILFENYAAALNEPGEWFLNNNGRLSYIPVQGESINNSRLIAPKLENLVSIKGDLSTGNYVENVVFEGITFKHCHYKIPNTGSEPNQAAIKINAAIMLEAARNITFSNCEVSLTGQHAIWFGKGCHNSRVEKCFLNNLGGGGIYLGDPTSYEGSDQTNQIKIVNNIIHNGGKEFPSAVGVWIGHSSDNEILHNDIANFKYTGVSVGWVWGYSPSTSKRNIISYNHIHHIGWDLLSDMAAVYTLGKSEGTRISNNVIHHIHAHSYGGWGLYTDEGSSDIVMENNLVYSTKTGAFHQHYGKNNRISNNIFAYSKLFQLQCTRVEDHLSFTFDHNIIVFDKGVLLKGAWEKINIEMDRNLYWNTANQVFDFNGNSFEQWQQTGHDQNSYVLDPFLNDPTHFDFSFTSNQSIQKIKFIPFDYGQAGVYGDAKWRKKALLPAKILKEFDSVVEKNMGGL